LVGGRGHVDLKGAVKAFRRANRSSISIQYKVIREWRWGGALKTFLSLMIGPV